MRAKCPTELNLLDSIMLIILHEEFNYKAPHYAVFTSLLLIPPSLTKYFPQYFLLKHFHYTFYPQDETEFHTYTK